MVDGETEKEATRKIRKRRSALPLSQTRAWTAPAPIPLTTTTTPNKEEEQQQLPPELPPPVFDQMYCYR